MKKIWIKDGCIGIIVAVVLDVIVFLMVSGIGMKCTGDICGPTDISSAIFTPLVSFLIWPAAVIQASLWRIVVLGVYYFVVGVLVGIIYRLIKNRVRTIK